MELPLTGRLVNWTPKQKSDVPDDIAVKLLSAGVGFLRDNDSAGEVAVYATDKDGNVTGLVAPGGGVIGVVLGPYTIATLPTASTYSGYVAKVSNVGGSTGSLFISDGVRWKPVNGVARLYATNAASSSMSGVTETIQQQILIPKGLLQTGDRIICKISQSKSSTAETATTRVRVGTAGTIADTQIVAIAGMTTTNVSIGWTLDLRVNTLITLQKMGGASVALPWGVSTGATPAAVTVPDLSANDVYLSFSSFMSSTVETTRFEDLIIDINSASA
jgi:hypothetical protein